MAPPKRSSPSSSGLPDRRALLQAYQDVIRTANEKPAPLPPEPPSRLPFWITSATLIVTLTVLTFWQPPWLFTPDVRDPPAMVEASLRVRIYSEILRIERFQAGNGRLPLNLAEARGDSSGVKYELAKTGYSLTGHSGALTIVYKSELPPKQFVGNSYALIRARPRS